MDDGADHIGSSGPYRGLAWYDESEDQIAVFSGRAKDVQGCVQRLFRSSVLVLHGRTGCGKSSFLRAGLHPFLKQTDLQPEQTRGEGKGSLEIRRTGQKPMAMLARAFHAFVTAASENESRDIHTQVIGALNEAQFIAACAERFSLTLIKAIIKLAELRPDLKPVFVLDQAEEMWTLARPEGDARANVEASDTLLTRAKALEERTKFFEFLHDFCRRAHGARVIISMRTEYKGQLDDEILAVGGVRGALPKAEGYYLEELNEDQIKAAILRPASPRKDPSGVELRQKYKFSYEGDKAEGAVAELIARALRDEKDGAPPGGVLPVMQVTCLRLYEMVKQTSADDMPKITVRDFKQLGKINKQIDFFVQDKLEEAVEAALKAAGLVTGAAAHLVAGEAEHWYNLLTSHFVNEESDGRVTTRKVQLGAIVQAGRAASMQTFREPMVFVGNERIETPEAALSVLRYLEKASILRSERSATVWSLGHDSVGLVLNRWKQTYGQQFTQHNKMEMQQEVTPDQFSREHLFPEGYEIQDVDFFTIRDNVWDRLFIQYAMEKGFAERLGLKLSTPQALDLRTDGVSVKTINEFMRKVHAGPAYDNFLVSWPRADFPDDEKANQWIDLVITSVYQGHGLICPSVFDIEHTPVSFEQLHAQLKHGDAAKQAEALETFRETIRKVIAFLEQKTASAASKDEAPTIWVYDQPAKDFVKLVIMLADANREMFPVDAAEAARRAAQRAEERDASADDFTDHFLEELHEEAIERAFMAPYVKELSDDDFDESDGGVRDPLFRRLRDYQSDFIVGPAFSRALALTTEHRSLIDVQHLPELIKAVCSQGGFEPPSSASIARRNGLIDRYQQTQSLTTWQVNFKREEMDDERIDPIVYRVAALALYTTEYVRTKMDGFVRFIYSDIKMSAGKGTFRLDRDAIRKTIADCFVFVPFEQYVQQYLDWKSDRAYQLAFLDRALKEKMGDPNDISSVRRVFAKMLDFRSSFLADFQAFNEQFIRLADDEDENRLDEVLTRANVYRECAWRNYQIHNFYDAALLIRRGRDELREKQKGFGHYKQRNNAKTIKPSVGKAASAGRAAKSRRKPHGQ